jgi:hypothetical protein
MASTTYMDQTCEESKPIQSKFGYKRYAALAAPNDVPYTSQSASEKEDLLKIDTPEWMVGGTAD